MLAHALYSCDQVNIDFDNFFSSTGNSHKISQLNHTDLIAVHASQLIHSEKNKIILTIECKDWFEILRIKFSYEKWYCCYPSDTSYEIPFRFTSPLPNQTHLENLVTKYFDSLTIDTLDDGLSESKLLLEDYLSGNFLTLEMSVVKNLNWVWNHAKSHFFYQKVLQANQKHLDWLDKIKNIVSLCCNFTYVDVNLLFWERAVVISKVCYTLNVNPADLHWNECGCFLEKNNVTLINSIERVKYGRKTI